MENYIEQCQEVRRLTLAPMGKIAAAVKEAQGDVAKAVEILVKQNAISAADMANRVANTSIVYSYVHDSRIGAMIVLACQTDFVAKHLLFQVLAKDICMHIVSTPTAPEYIDRTDVPAVKVEVLTMEYGINVPSNKPEAIRKKIIDGKLEKFYTETCLLNQKFIKDDSQTIQQLIQAVSATVGEKIEIKSFIKVIAQ